MLAELLVDRLIDGLQVRFNAANERVRTPFLKWEGPSIVEITAQEMLDSLLVRNINGFTYSQVFIDALTRRVARCDPLMLPVTVQVKHHMNMIEKQQ